MKHVLDIRHHAMKDTGRESTRVRPQLTIGGPGPNTEQKTGPVPHTPPELAMELKSQGRWPERGELSREPLKSVESFHVIFRGHQVNKSGLGKNCQEGQKEAVLELTQSQGWWLVPPRGAGKYTEHQGVHP